MQNLKKSTLIKFVTILVFNFMILASASTQFNREVLSMKRASSKILVRLRNMAKIHNSEYQRNGYTEAYYQYENIHSAIRKFHKRVLKKGQLGTDKEGEYTDELAYKETLEFIQYLDKLIPTFSKTKGYEKLPSSRKILISQISASVLNLAEMLKEEDIYIQISKPLREVARVYQKQEEFLKQKEELLGDFYNAQDELEISLTRMIDHLSLFIKRNHGPRKEYRRPYTAESYDYIKYKKILKEVEELLEDFDINDGAQFAKLTQLVSQTRQLVNLTKTNTKNARVLLSRVYKTFNLFSLEAKSLNKRLVVIELDPTLGLKEMEFKYYRATQVCSLLGGPGNILLRRSLESDIDLFEDFSPRTSGAIKLVEFLKFNDRSLEFRHAEIITEIERDTRINTMGFYPLSFNWGKEEEDKMPPFLEIKKGYRKCHSDGCDTYDDYRTNFAWLRVNEKSAKKMTRTKEKALKKVENKEDYSKLGVCSDFVNWAFGNVITSNWNQIPIVRNLIQIIYPPEGLQTPDNLYDSYKTDVICEVERRKLKYPHYINAHHLKDQVLRDLNSQNPAISTHAKNTLNELIKKNIMDNELNLNYDVINFETK
ncbi:MULTISPECIES: hypothetical protein [unclassified Halobacteriovorax]|uniref:hypothetical protein n=1 Tax=unclassified Halobacteriovorax TaxID=2639665 RepID=UPI00399BFA0E